MCTEFRVLCHCCPTVIPLVHSRSVVEDIGSISYCFSFQYYMQNLLNKNRLKIANCIPDGKAQIVNGECKKVVYNELVL